MVANHCLTNVSGKMKIKKLVLHSYVVKSKSTSLQNVLLFSSVQPLLGTTKENGTKKPTIYKLYEFTEGGTDVMDQEWQLLVAKQSQIDVQ